MTDQVRLEELAYAEEPRAGTASRLAFARLGDDGVTEVLLIRHAQMPATVDPNLDQSLTPLGLEQAEVLAAFLARRPLAAVYASPTLRTKETAAAIARYQGLDVTLDAELRELEAYIPEGLTLADVLDSQAVAEAQDRFRRERRWEAYRGYRETGAAASSRMTAAIEAIIERHRGGRIAVVSHGPVINAYLASILASSYDMLLLPRLTSVSVVLARGDLRSVLVANSTTHFQVY